MADESHAYLVVDRFHEGARRMRRELDRRFSDALDPFDPARFAWERWHIPDQFSQLRAPARAIFSTDAMAAFEERLLAWAGRATGLSLLGGPPWLSVLCDGDFQSLHRDSPNGLLAFSFGLGTGAFTGGHTLLARPELTEYWRLGAHRAEVADTPMFDELAPAFNRVVAFDSRVPHAVRRVEGPRHPRDGRTAIQGWIRPAGCVVRGSAGADEATDAIDAALRKVPRAAIAGTDGLVTVAADVGRGGLRAVRETFRTLVCTSDAGDVARASDAIVRAVGRAKVRGAGSVVAPVIVSPEGCFVGRAEGPTGV